MKYQRFEDLPVWQLAADLAAKMFEWTQNPSFRAKGDLANQLQRATLSISNNIAEGFERGTTNRGPSANPRNVPKNRWRDDANGKRTLKRNSNPRRPQGTVEETYQMPHRTAFQNGQANRRKSEI